jgi:hypothetical protein
MIQAQTKVLKGYGKSINHLRLLASGILFVLGALGIIGGVSMIIEPSGSWLGLNIEQLSISPFKNYLIPGILLTTVIGLDSFILAYFAFRNFAFSAPLMVLQGIILLVWLTIEYNIGFSYPAAQLPTIFLAMGLILLGIRLNRFVPA